MHVNLLPPSFVWRRLIRKRLRQWACAFGFVAIAFIGGNAPLLAQWWLDLREFQVMHLAAEPVLALQAERIALAQKTLVLTQNIKQLRAVTSQDRSTAILGIVAKSIGSSSSAVQLQEMQVAVETKPIDAKPDRNPVPSANPVRASLPVENKLNANQYHLTLKAIAIESEAISKFMENLEKSNVFPKVELRSTLERFVSGRSIQEFQLESIGNE